MAIRKIVQEGDELLLKKCRAVEKFDQKLAELIDDMLETMYDASGVGLAAPQVGILRRVVVIDVGEGPLELVNPQIIAKRGVQKEVEGCLSCPGIYGVTKRPKWVKVRAQDRQGELHEYEGEELLARAFCHELDHLDGVLFRTHVLEYLDPEDDE